MVDKMFVYKKTVLKSFFKEKQQYKEVIKIGYFYSSYCHLKGHKEVTVWVIGWLDGLYHIICGVNVFRNDSQEA